MIIVGHQLHIETHIKKEIGLSEMAKRWEERLCVWMNYSVIGRKKLREVQEGIDQFLYDQGKGKSENGLNVSVDDEISFGTQVASKPKRERESVPRICLKMLYLNTLTVTKLPITLFSSKRKQPNLQIHFCIDTNKQKLSFSPLPAQTLITITLAKGEMVIESKNVAHYHLQAGTEGSKPKWMPRANIDNAKMVVSYHSKRYHQEALDGFFRSNGVRFQVVDSRPKASTVQMEIRIDQKSRTREFVACKQPDIMQRIINGDGVDWPVQRMLAVIRTNKTNTHPLPQQPSYQLEKVEKQVQSVAEEYKSQNDCQTGQQPHQQANYKYQQQVSGPTFKKPTPEQLQESYSSRQSIIDLQPREKQSILLEILKIKQFKHSDYSIQDKKLPCPIYTCNSIHQDQHQLRTHILTTHKQLSNYGLRVASDGRLHYTQKTINFVLQLAWLFPTQIKKIIKRMKAK